MPRNGIFLSGWEYNRIIDEDPIAPRQSALPAEALWNGAAQFWLFEHVYCTHEAYQGELAAAETLGWATGRIFKDLKRRGFLQPISLGELQSLDELRSEHARLRSSLSESQLAGLLSDGAHDQLEEIKQQLLQPVFEELHCITNFSPNSIQTWRRKMGRVEERNFVRPELIIRAGFQLCRTPGSGLPESVLAAQREVERQVQSPMIPDLLLGRLPQRDYMAVLERSSVQAYAPIDRQLWGDYEKQISKLEYLRDIAKQDLWPDLHNEWLPRLEAEPGFIADLQARVADALRRTKYDPYLEYFTIFLIASAIAAVGYSAHLVANFLGAPPESAVAAMAGVGGVLQSAHAKIRKGTDRITAFLQKAAPVAKL